MQQHIEIIEEDLDPDYVPTREELHEYAVFLGMDPKLDSQYLYIAQEGLTAPLPYPWKQARTSEGEICYYNSQTQVLSEEHPLDEIFKRKFIEAKKKDLAKQPSKTSNKLKNLCQNTRDEDLDISIPSISNASNLQDIKAYEKQAQEDLEQHIEYNRKKLERESKALLTQQAEEMPNYDEEISNLRVKQKKKQAQLKEDIEEELTQDFNNQIRQLKLQSETLKSQYEEIKDNDLETETYKIKRDQRQKILQQEERIEQLLEQQREMKKKSMHEEELNRRWQELKSVLDKEFQDQKQLDAQKMSIELEQKKAQIKEQIQVNFMTQQTSLKLKRF